MVQEHDPYGEMLEGAKSDIRPSLPGEESRKKEKKAKRESGAGDAKSELKDAESGASGGLYKNGASAKEQEENAGGFSYTGKGKSETGGKKKGLLGGKFKFAKMSAAAITVMMVVLVGAATVIFTTPIFQIGHLDFNLQDALGFTKTSGILQKAATRIIKNKLSKGEVPAALAGDLAEHGINVGQVTASGDFVRTNVYIADVDKLKDVATLGHYEVTPSEGELAVLYDGQVILADDFVNTVESNMKMFADYTEALDISARYYYSDDVNNIYSKMGLDRGVFSSWVDTGDTEKNKEKFSEMMEKALDNSSSLTVAALDEASTNVSVRKRSKNTLIAPAVIDETGSEVYRPSQSTTDVTGDETQGQASEGVTQNEGSYWSKQVSGGGDASSIIQEVAEGVTGDSATSRAAHLLNAAISAGEPYLAASAFIGIESPIQQARIDGTGPVNELMNMLNTESSITYRNVSTGENETVKQSILTTGNFVAAVSGGTFSKKEAANFARDRAILATGMQNKELINATSVESVGQKESKMMIPISRGDSASADELMILNDSIDMAMVKSNYSLLPSQAGGNRIVEGGSFLSNTINAHVIGAMPSDEETIAAYNREAKTELARMAAAERATKSPFDISSPYTFMGSIVHGFADAMIRSGGNGNIVSGSISTVASLTDDSAKGLWGTVMADGETDADFGTTYGGYCNTVQSVGTEGDIYCTPHGTISTGYLDYTEEDWKNALGDNLNDSGKIADKTDLSEFLTNGTDRWATVGVESPEICEKYHEDNDNWLESIGNKIKGWLRMYEACKGYEDIATGRKYVFSNDSGNKDVMKMYAGFVLYDEVSSLLGGTVSRVSEFKEGYYKEHPLDNSRAGTIARISGMTKQEAEVALAYADYLTFIARYNPAERYAFGVNLMPPESREPLVEHASQVAVDLYVMWHGRTEYDDLRTRTRVA
ncbi:hypothetical protein IJG22_03565 [Candidatus Saccharibacteria bacterium]|nr:hypothetical protein [Candidatus Saccharibacteria bacterium]